MYTSEKMKDFRRGFNWREEKTDHRSRMLELEGLWEHRVSPTYHLMDGEIEL
jgi:hypothetical protein